MSEPDDRYARHDLPRTTGEFRAAPDSSASTAQFQAFAAGQDTRADRRSDEGSWPEQPWAGGATKSTSGRTAVLIVGIVVVVAVIAAFFLFS
jgi:hypothetical protein